MNRAWFGLTICVVLAVAATLLGGIQHIMGAPMIGLLLGMLVMNLLPVGDEFLKGAKFASKKVLNLAIVLAGGTLNLQQILGTGRTALPLLVINILLALLVANLVGRRLGVNSSTATLIGSGTSICGGTAIATTASIIRAKEVEIAFAMTAIFFFDVIGALLFPYVAVGLNLSETQMGLLLGGAINDMSSVTAAEATYSKLVGREMSVALTVKLTRTTLLIPLALVLTGVTMRRTAAQRAEGSGEEREGLGATLRRIIPWAIVAFVVMAVLNSVGLFDALSGAVLGDPSTLGEYLKTSYKFLTTVALAGVGFKIKIRDLLTKGARPVLLGGVTWLAVTGMAALYCSLIG